MIQTSDGKLQYDGNIDLEHSPRIVLNGSVVPVVPKTWFPYKDAKIHLKMVNRSLLLM